MKGTVYSGVIYMPQHPTADMAGLLRATVRTSGRVQVETALAHYGVAIPPTYWRYGLWRESQSASELHATETHYGEVLVCPLTLAFLKPDNYQPLGKEYLVRKSQESIATPPQTHSPGPGSSGRAGEVPTGGQPPANDSTGCSGPWRTDRLKID